MIEVLIELNIPSFSFLSSTNLGIRKKEVVINLGKQIKKIPELISKVSNSIQIINSYKFEKTVQLEIKVSLINYGDTDGLLRKQGELLVDYNGLRLPLKLKDGNNDYRFWRYNNRTPVIEKKSYKEFVYLISLSDLSDKNRELIQKIVKEGKSGMQIILKDIREDEIKSSEKKYLL